LINEIKTIIHSWLAWQERHSKEVVPGFFKNIFDWQVL